MFTRTKKRFWENPHLVILMFWGKQKEKTTSVESRINIKKLILLKKLSKKMEDNNNYVRADEVVNLSDLEILHQTTVELELSGNKPTIENDPKADHDSGEVTEIPEEENSEEEHDTELNPNADQTAENNEDQLRYVFETVEGERYIIQGTSDRRVEMITLEQGGNQSAQENSETDSENEVTIIPKNADTSNVPTETDGSGRANVPAMEIEATREQEYQITLDKGKELGNLLDEIERKTDNKNDISNQRPDPEEELEIPDEETSEEEHDIELENANQQAWENRSAAQKEYLETLEAGRTRRKLILRCMRNPGKVKLDPLLSLYTILIGIPDPRIERWDELTQECFSNNAVVKLDRNNIPNWYRAQRNAANNRAQDKSEEHTDTNSDEDEEVKFVGAILKSESKYGGVVDGATSIARNIEERTKAPNNNANKCKCGEHTTNIGETECSICR